MGHSTATKAQQNKTAGQILKTGTGVPHRLNSPAPQGDLEVLQRYAGNRAVHGLVQGGVPPIVQSVISRDGQPPDPTIRAEMESSFGQDFGEVRVHTDPRAAESAGAVSANAYTVGWDVVFGQNRYAPDSREGRRLLAHELVHAVQQRRRGPGLSTAEGERIEDDAEREADHVAERVTDERLPQSTPAITAAPAGGIARGSILDVIKRGVPIGKDWTVKPRFPTGQEQLTPREEQEKLRQERQEAEQRGDQYPNPVGELLSPPPVPRGPPLNEPVWRGIFKANLEVRERRRLQEWVWEAAKELRRQREEERKRRQREEERLPEVTCARSA